MTDVHLSQWLAAVTNYFVCESRFYLKTGAFFCSVKMFVINFLKTKLLNDQGWSVQYIVKVYSFLTLYLINLVTKEVIQTCKVN